jgi:hypothetical protein
MPKAIDGPPFVTALALGEPKSEWACRMRHSFPVSQRNKSGFKMTF